MRNKIFPITAHSMSKNILGIEYKGVRSKRIAVINPKNNKKNAYL